MGIKWSGKHYFKRISILSGGQLDVESGANLKLAGTAITATATELNYVDGVTSPIQTQLDDRIRVAAVEISSVDILALYTTAKVLVAAPGAGKVLEFVSLLLAYDAGATAYTVTSATNLAVKITDKNGTSVSTTQAVTGMIDQETDQVRILDKVGTTITPVVNAPLCLSLAGADPTEGDGVIHAKIVYRVLATGL